MIVIKTSMPRSCIGCPCRNGVFCAVNNKRVYSFGIERPEDCPIVAEIPNKHGRLIDADKLLPESGYDPMMFKPKYGGDHRTQYDTLMGYEILGIVENAPTILEATE